MARISGFGAGLTARSHSAAEQGSEFTHHCRKTEQPGACARQEIDEEVDIAVRPHLTARRRTEE